MPYGYDRLDRWMEISRWCGSELWTGAWVGATKDVVHGLFSVNLLDKITNACNPKRPTLLVVFQKIRVSDD